MYLSKLTALSKKKLELSERIAILENVNPRQAEGLKEELISVTAEVEEWRSKVRSAIFLLISCSVKCE